MLSSQRQYKEVPHDDWKETVISSPDSADAVEAPVPRHSRHRQKQICILLVGMAIVAILLVWFISVSTSPATTESQEMSRQQLHCGNTTAQAKALGCEFDLLSYTWLPEECIERETTAEFKEWVASPDRQFGSWPFFADRHGEEWIPDEETLSERAGLKTHTTQEEHLGHCTFMMRRMQRSKEKRMRTVALDDMNHVIHCSNEILRGLKGPNPQDVNRLNAVFIVSFNSC